MKKIRCAIYTRKSAEEVSNRSSTPSMRSERPAPRMSRARKRSGWVLLPTRSTRTRSISGGTLERPGLQRLLDDIDAGLVDRDCGLQGRPTDPFPLRLCEARRPARRGQHRVCLGDPVLQHRDQHGTTDAAYAAVLRTIRAHEVTAERIRDKVAASKRKGLWMGGRVPLGYEKDGARCASTRLRPKRSGRSMRCTGSTERSGR